MRRLWLAAAIAMLGSCTALAQVGGMSGPTPGISATSPLGMSGASQAGTSVGPTGIPLGSTELTSPGIRPMFTDPTGMTASGTTCPAGGISGISAYDGGGLSGGGMGGPRQRLPRPPAARPGAEFHWDRSRSETPG
jgi:hypothetical protein